MSKAMGFSCHKFGHRAMKDVPEQVYILEGYPHVGRVCKACKCNYFEQVSDQLFAESPIVDQGGNKILSEEN